MWDYFYCGKQTFACKTQAQTFVAFCKNADFVMLFLPKPFLFRCSE
uniref:Uncharacterized protein n=1 Tax=Anopheles quadriannulatus TaxID=34691 RepID=A0A182XTS2_ANOQN